MFDLTFTGPKEQLQDLTFERIANELTRMICATLLDYILLQLSVYHILQSFGLLAPKTTYGIDIYTLCGGALDLAFQVLLLQSLRALAFTLISDNKDAKTTTPRPAFTSFIRKNASNYAIWAVMLAYGTKVVQRRQAGLPPPTVDAFPEFDWLMSEAVPFLRGLHVSLTSQWILGRVLGWD
ncbi:uncharacterized protein LTR77_008361 [Saxophila tyrrhenica]|uniref:Uncharacterized protein n=1 Tax=Saxophila tyrrhenica TaxID=1690608 RepID=A0AAV9P170_9PEZI|nr:hypothetical protein LTR77_008361 [Saxophila tyrrhenica]